MSGSLRTVLFDVDGTLIEVLASSAGEAESGVLRAVLDAEDAIDDATFSGDVEQTKPAPDLVQVALEKAAVPAEQAVFVGDTVWDVLACRRPEYRASDCSAAALAARN